MRAIVCCTPIDVIDLPMSIAQVSRWGQSHESRVVNFCNVHSIISASKSAKFAQTLNQGDLNLADGAPIANWIKRKYALNQERISGPDFMAEYLKAAKQWREKVYLYGNTEAVLKKLIAQIHLNYPWIEVVGSYAPPFSNTAQQETHLVIAQINGSGANTLWVSLGCPKQELWLALHKHQIQCVMLAVGAAFPLIAGQIPRAPQWMREHSLEWAYRLYREPRRLMGRYFYTNLLFTIFLLKDIFVKN